MVAEECCQIKQQRDKNSSTRKDTEIQDVKHFFKKGRHSLIVIIV